jgi:hypothetical protein
MNVTHKTLFDFGYSFLSPMLNKYAREIKLHCTNSRAVCLAREGWAFNELLQHLSNKNLLDLDRPPIYLKVSRTVLFRSLLGAPDVWSMALASSFSGSLTQLLNKRFGLQLHEIFQLIPEEVLSQFVELPKDSESITATLAPYNEAFFNHVKPTRDAMISYFELEGLFSEDAGLTFLDLGYSGTIQKLITKMLQRDTSGLYFIANSAGQNPVGNHIAMMKGVFRENVKWSDGYLMLERSLLLESLLTAPHGQVLDIRKDSAGRLDFYYGRSAAPQRHFQDLSTVIAGAIQGVEDGFRYGVEFTVPEIEDLFKGFAISPSAIPKSVFHLFDIDDEFSGNGMMNTANHFGL